MRQAVSVSGCPDLAFRGKDIWWALSGAKLSGVAPVSWSSCTCSLSLAKALSQRCFCSVFLAHSR